MHNKCLAPIAKIINDYFKIKNGLVLYTPTQTIKNFDVAHVDLFRARSATESLIPTKTGAAQLLVKLFQNFKARWMD